MIKFKKLKGINIGPFEEFTLDITPGRHLIIGKNMTDENCDSNGSGKSTLLESLTWVLFKNSPRGIDISRNWKGNSSGVVELSANGSNYIITRYRGDKTHGNNVQILVDDNDISQRLASQADNEIIKLLGMDYDLFTSTVVILQGLPSNFTTMLPTARKQMIEGMLGFSLWDELKSLLEAFTKQVIESKTKVSDQFTKEREKMIALNSRLQALKEASQVQENKILEEIQQVKMEMRPILDRLKELEAEKSRINVSLVEIKNKINDLNFEYDGLVNKAKDLKMILKQNICPTCKQNYPQTMIQKAKEELERILPATEDIINKKEKLVETQNKIEFIMQEQAKIEASKLSFEKQISRLIAKLDSKPEDDSLELVEELKKLTELVNIIKSDLDTIDKDLSHLKYLDDLLKPSSKFRGQILERYLSYVNTILNQISPLILDKIMVNLILQDKRGVGVDLVVTKDKKEVSYKSLSGGERRRVDIVLILGFQKFLLDLHNISTNLLFFDEIMDPLDKKGVESVLNCLDSIFPQNMAVYIISHSDSFKSMFDDTISVVKVDNISYIE